MILLQAGTISLSITAIFASIIAIGGAIAGIFIRRALNLRDEKQKVQDKRLTKLEETTSEQKVTNQEMIDYQKYRDLKDTEYSKLVKQILENIDSLKESFDTKFGSLTREIHDLEVKFTAANSQ